ncbi:MAG TPA: LCP family protein [Candidatus Limnocylindrales bacterium]|nr:LCP family protein [Candidatus Limnocylindrales bacterium]
MSNNPSPALAALLSFLFPGLGQLYAGDARKAVLWALPMLGFIIAALWLLVGGVGAITGLVSSPEKRLALLIVNVAFFLYHIAAMINAYDMAKQERASGFGRSGGGAAPIILAGLIALAMIVHGVPEVWGVQIHNSFSSIFDGDNDGALPSFSPRPTRSPTPIPSASPSGGPTATPSTGTGSPDPSGSGEPGPSETPRACPPIDLGAWPMADGGRVNLLLVGSDSRSDDGVSSASIRTDSMLLLSIDVATCKSAMFSFPRNMEQPSATSRYPSWLRIPTENGPDYQGYLFGLWQKAATTPGQLPGEFPGSDGIGPECAQQFDCERGWRALTYAIQEMAGVDVDGIVSVNLKGFVDVVNNLPEGGLWIDVPSPLFDDEYFNSQQQKMLIDFEAGCQFMNGEEALAYARSRHQDSDYQRSRRQQYVLAQVRKQLDPVALLPHIPTLLTVAQENLFMTIDDSDIPFLAQVASRVDSERIYRYDFAPAKLTQLGSPEGMIDKVQNIFSEPEPAPTTRPNQEPCPPRN